MPSLDVSELNIVLAILGTFIVLYGIISVKIKQRWYLGEALPAVAIGVVLGPIAAKFLDSERWGSAERGQTSEITLGVTRVMIGLQLVIAGYQLPAKYNLTRWKEMTICLLPVMTIMWLCTTLCIMATVPKLTLLAALVIGSCVTCTDPILSQAIAKGPFADKYVARPLRELISSEAGANDGFGFPFLMLAVYLIRYADIPRAGGVGVAMKNWFLETWLYIVLLSVLYGAVVGYGSCKAIKFALRRKWIDGESYLLFPAALGMFLVGTCGAIGTDDLLACFVAGNALNWDGRYLEETENRHDEVNSCIDVLLNFGLTYGRLFLLGFMVLIFRRIPSILITYKLMPDVVKNWKEALFMGYFGPIGAGAVFYLEHTRHLFPKPGEGDREETELMRAIGPVVYWLVLFSIVFHGLSIPALNLIYSYMGVKPIRDDAVEIRRVSMRVATPTNAVPGDRSTFIAYNRFSRPIFDPSTLPVTKESFESMDNDWSGNNYLKDAKGFPPENEYKWKLNPSTNPDKGGPRIRYAE
ncbi:sodium/hydrogen exchanger family protein [Hirsutella rhossiliensis]|uniref:Sodium/hydrogen exchanger family domain-containing protein n=1 Tax=Hirsutella rhossiliensis TaxID=111463 RepID=A0A9P8N6U0_9HYPO|nr:sodium/hydrogen exchanger family domain-containing protein [Hirsutella rhossiliensis]KAH0967824.1 sodium/hydrogen exchanger family domain-containing protein [Hirsutella rhossiliensis]